MQLYHNSESSSHVEEEKSQSKIRYFYRLVFLPIVISVSVFIGLMMVLSLFGY